MCNKTKQCSIQRSKESMPECNSSDSWRWSDRTHRHENFAIAAMGGFFSTGTPEEEWDPSLRSKPEGDGFRYQPRPRPIISEEVPLSLVQPQRDVLLQLKAIPPREMANCTRSMPRAPPAMKSKADIRSEERQRAGGRKIHQRGG